MSREIKKQSLDDRLMFSDDFDESMLDLLEGGEPDSNQQLEKRPLADNIGDGEIQNDSQDDVPSLDADRFAEGPTKEEENGSPDVESASDEERVEKPLSAGIHQKKRLIILVATGSLLTLGILVSVVMWRHAANHSPAPSNLTSMIRHPVVIPHYQKTETFYLYVDNGQRKDIFELSMELDFIGDGSQNEQQPSEINLRDSIYQFLQSGKPPENPYKYWEKAIHNDLPLHLKAAFPKNYPLSLRIVQLGRL